MARLITTSGVQVDVADEKVDRLLASGNYKLPDDGPASQYAGLKVADLKAEIESRNEGRDDDAKIPAEGSKAKLIAAIEADDAANGQSEE